ncbi:SPOR domain-containing protein [Oryzomonas japonica]|uniref:SPOR domain-containing protein n=1 Tax=Oryzomonas japonica TaxID=2603858 RepID=A0A7J4ZRV7_9BACT|nr:SPOR domain-containing protein [Oryzomonas japonica]KAB0665826.1 SPOR domain-containing protein [Oryzomonas japonica]
MDFKFGNDTKEPESAAPAEKGRQNMLLVVLLILVAAFAYLYFFTGLIKPQEAQKPAETPAPQVVKKPLPPRNGQTAKDETAGAPGAQKNAAAPAAPEAKKVASAEPPAAVKAAPEAKVEPPKPEAAKPAKPAAPEKKPAVPEKKPAVPEKKAAPAAKEPKAATAAKQDAKKAVPVTKQQPAGAVKKPAPAQGSDKKSAEAAKAPGKSQAGAAAVPAKKAAPATAKKDTVKPKPAPAKATGPWTVVVGNYVLEEAMATDLSRVKGAGIETAVKPGGRKKSAMNRLLAGEYPSRVEAQQELDKLKRYTSDAFIMDQGGKFAVYAGSYLLTARAGSEKERLAAAGINLTVKHAEVSIPSKTLVAGTFSDRKGADAVLKKLKGLGIKASLSHP